MDLAGPQGANQRLPANFLDFSTASRNRSAMGVTPGNPQIVERAFAARTPSTTSKLVALGGVVVSIAYLANLTFGGFIPLEIPDALPIVGNLDEVFFSGVLIACLNHLGIPLLPNFRATTPPRDDVRMDGPK